MACREGLPDVIKLLWDVTMRPVMRYVKFLPIAFFSGIHGFALFAPYAAVVVTISLAIKKLKPEKLSDPIDTVEDDELLESQPV